MQTLKQYLKEHIKRKGKIAFSEFMRIALYHPQTGYYTKAKYPPRADFRTAPEMTSAFGGLTANFLKQILDDGKSEFFLWELGAGRGKLAEDILRAGLKIKGYFLVELNPAAQSAISVLKAKGYPVFWADDIAGCEPSKHGIVVANEFFDALPVEVVKKIGGEIFKLHIASKNDKFYEVWNPAADTEILDFVASYAPCIENGQRIEVPVCTKGLLHGISKLFEIGAVLIFDYGARSKTLYSPAHKKGTLKTHFRHTVSDDVLESVGDKDITASVNFSYIEDIARALGFKAQTTELCAFLISSGAEDMLKTDMLSPAERAGFLSLLDPDGMGGLFQVCVLSRGIKAPEVKKFRAMLECL